MIIKLLIFVVILISKLTQADYGFEHMNHLMSFHNAVNYCKGRHKTLTKIDSLEKNNLVLQYAKTEKIDKYWINANDIAEESEWVDTEDDEIPYRNWGESQPNGGYAENCAHISVSHHGAWEDIDCNGACSVICESTKYTSRDKAKMVQINYLSLGELMTFHAATNYCSSRNMDLVTINDPVTNTLVCQYALVRNLGKFWISGNDIRQESVWVDGKNNEISFKNWHIVEPNGGRNENCIEGGFSPFEYWVDIPCNLTKAVICQPRES